MESAKRLIDYGCLLYFPSDRFEQPGWLNAEGLINRIEYQDLKKEVHISNRSIIINSSLKTCQKWLLDLLLDRNTLGFKPLNLPISNSKGEQIGSIAAGVFDGQAAYIYDEVLRLLNILFQVPDGTLRFGLGDRTNRVLSIMRNEKRWVPNLFQLSSGEVLLLDLLLNIIRDYDLSKSIFNSLSSIKGIVLIDEIDSHLHGRMQKEILPTLIKLFPKIQFIITTHSPMFLLGMQQFFGTSGFDIIEMPEATPISVENFSEFRDLFTAVSETMTYLSSIKQEIEKSHLPIVFFEGDYDVKYLTKTIELFYAEQKLFDKFRLADGDGFGNLDRIWKSMDSRVAEVLTTRTLLLYDCDIAKKDSIQGKVVRKTIPTIPANPIDKGIENLLSPLTIEKLEKVNPKFIDITCKHDERVRGKVTSIPEKKAINKDEKKNICDWLCNNGEPADFEGFKIVIKMIFDFLDNNLTNSKSEFISE
jgi:hypothetical protein